MPDTTEEQRSIMSVGWGCLVAVGGVLMGIANLIPGVSGGTMILAVGIYEEFIESVAEISSLRFSWRRVVFLALVMGFAGTAIFLLSGAILSLLLWHAPIMFALFIGLTLGGAPLLIKMIGNATPASIAGTIAGIALMAGIALAKDHVAMPRNPAMDVVSGVVGSTTMVLPGISGSYMLLILDQYDRVIGAVADLKDRNFKALRIIAPVGIGAVIGIVGLSNLLKYLLSKRKDATLGVLLGMLLGSVLGLWPFDKTPPLKALERCTEVQLIEFADVVGIEGAADQVGIDARADHIVKQWKARKNTDLNSKNIALASLMLVAGFVCTLLLGRLDKSKNEMEAHDP